MSFRRDSGVLQGRPPSTPASRSATPKSSPGTPTPRTTEHYDRARGNLDRNGVHFLTAYVAGVQMTPTPVRP